MKRNDPQFQEMVSRIESGELTRAAAAHEYKINLGTLGVWLARSGIKDKGAKKLHGAATQWGADPAKDVAYKAALDELQNGPLGAKEVAEKHGLSYQMLLRKNRDADRKHLLEVASRYIVPGGLTASTLTRGIRMPDFTADAPDMTVDGVKAKLNNYTRMLIEAETAANLHRKTLEEVREKMIVAQELAHAARAAVTSCRSKLTALEALAEIDTQQPK